MTTTRHYTGFWVKDAIATIVCACFVATTLSACNDSTNTQSATANLTPTAPPINPPVDEGFSLNSLLNSIEGAKSGVKDAVGPHADAVQTRTKEEVEKLFRWEYKVIESPGSLTTPELERTLGELGSDGWECFHIDRLSPDQTRVTCKRRPKSAISYLKYIPGL